MILLRASKKTRGVLFFLLFLLEGHITNAGAPTTPLDQGYQFHKETSLSRTGLMKKTFHPKTPKPAKYKTYPDAPFIQLPKPSHEGILLEEAIQKRRSVRNYSPKPLSLEQVSQLLFAAQGISGEVDGESLRTVPSAGALYPYEIYLVVNNVKGLSRGIYHYAVRSHALELIKAGDFSQAITRDGLEQDMLGQSAVTFVLAAVFDRTAFKYGERGYRYVYMEAGHISQNIHLQAVSLGLGTVSVGAFMDEAVNQLVGIDGIQEAVIYLQPVGVR